MASSRVNSRFVVILAVVISVAFVAVAGVGVLMLRKSAEQLAAMAEREMANANYEKATLLYSKAVNKDQADPTLLEKWIDALQHLNPEKAQEYRDRYNSEYLPALHQLAEVRKTDVDAHRRYLDELYLLMARSGAGLGGWENLVGAADEALRNFDSASKDGQVLRRYRAMARQQMLALGNPLDREKLEQIREDYTATLEADPDDAEAATNLAAFEYHLATKARQAQDGTTAGEQVKKAREVVNNFLEKHPKSVAGLLQQLRIESGEAIRAKLEAREPLTDPLVGQGERIKALLEVVRGTAPEALEPMQVAAVAQVAARTPGEGPEGAISLIDHALKARPDDALLLRFRAEHEAAAGKPEVALATLEQLVNLPNKPVSMEGLVLLEARNRAVAKQVELVLSQIRPGLTTAERTTLLDRARTYRDKLVSRIGTDRDEVTVLDARLHFVEGNATAARITLTPYLEGAGAKNREAQFLMAQILLMSGAPGEARRCLQRVVDMEPGNVQAHMQLAQLAEREGDLVRAESHIQMLTELDPTNKEYERLLRSIREAAKKDKTTDKTQLALRGAIDKISAADPDFPGAIAIVRKAMSDGDTDPRLFTMLVQLQISSGDRSGAIKTVEDALAKAPDDAGLKAMRQQLDYTDALDMRLGSIDAMDATDLQKHLLRCSAYLNSGRQDDAYRELDAAAAIDPEDKTVLELRFIRALSKRDADEAGRLVDLAIAKDADGLGGLSYRGRLALQEGRFADSANAFKQATEIDRFSPMAWRYLGDARLGLGEYEQAAAAYARALEIRPDDVACQKGAIRAEYLRGNPEGALATARRLYNAENRLARQDPAFVELWLELESTATTGDRAAALEERQAIAKRRPEDRVNKIRLAMLMLDQKRFDEARTLIDDLRRAAAASTDAADPDGMLNVVELDARWHTAKGDAAAARKSYTDYIATLPADKRTDAPFVRYAQLLQGLGMNTEAVEALKEGASHQDPKIMAADRELAGLYMRIGQFEDAERTLKRVLAGAASDPGHQLLRGIVQCQLQLKQYDRAEETVRQIENAESDQGLLFLLVQAAMGRNDLPKARQLLDRAVQANSNSPMGYIARADFIMASEPDRLRDAESDLRTAIHVDAKNTIARTRLFQIYQRTGRWDEALTAIQEAVGADPDNDGLRIMLVNALVGRGEAKAATVAIDEALRRKPDSIQWAMMAADVYGQAGTACNAKPIMERAWQRQKDVMVALAYTEVLLKCQPPLLGEAMAVVSEPSLKADTHFALLMTRGRINLLGGRARDAETDFAGSLRLLQCDNEDQVRMFFEAFKVIIPNVRDQVALLDRIQTGTTLTGWCQLNTLMIRAGDPAARPGLIPQIQSLGEQSVQANPALAYRAFATLAGIAGEEKRYEDAAGYFKRCLDLAPESPEPNNNLAYVLCENLNRPEEALPHAEKAAKGLPYAPGILDTLGTCYLRIGQAKKDSAMIAKALDTLRRAERAAANNSEKAAVFLHLAQTYLAQGNRLDATSYADWLDRILADSADLKRTYEAGLDEVRRKLAE